MFTNIMINKLEKKGYKILTPTDVTSLNEIESRIARLVKEKTVMIRKFNNLLKSSVKNMTIKSMRDDLATAGITDIPVKKAELIDLYVKTFQQ